MTDCAYEQVDAQDYLVHFEERFGPIDQLTPAMKQFMDVKLQYPQTLVLFRLGDFYETFFDDAQQAHQLIGITLTKRGKTPNGQPIPMAGIPMVSLEMYIARLVKLGVSVVIVEQVGQPNSGTMTRKISRIVTPGTLTDTALLPEKADAPLLAVMPGRKKDDPTAFVWLTLSNGRFLCEEVASDAIEDVLARLMPSEILVNESTKEAWRERFPNYTFTALPKWHFDAERGRRVLCEHFELIDLQSWGLNERTSILAATNALLDYVHDTQRDLVAFILPLKEVTHDTYVVIDAASRRNLEITQSNRPDQDGLTLLSVLDHCATSMGSRLMRRWLSEPLRDATLARERHQALAYLCGESSAQKALNQALKSLPDLERITTRLAMKTVRPLELASLRDALPTLASLVAPLTHSGVTLFSAMAPQLTLSPQLYETLQKALLDEPSTFLRDGDVLRSGWSEELDALRALRDNASQILVDIEARERQTSGIANLRVEYNKVQGFYIEVSKGNAGSVPSHYQRKQTLKNVERFITPELKTLEDRVLSSKERASHLEKQLYDALLDELSGFIEALSQAAYALASLDVLVSWAYHAQRHHWVQPTLSTQSGLRIQGARHPVVETTIEHYVPNDCRLENGRRLLLITGPNMGGKSTYMRSVALIALLAWAGAFVPATQADIGPIDRIHTRVGASDDLARGRSTFMVEMTEAASILHHATDRSLVLMDEIGRGTSTYDGLSLAAAIAQELTQNTRSLTLFATHYFELTQLAQTLSEVANIHVSATQSKKGIVFEHRIQEGAASKSYGIAVAQLAGVPASVVRRAKSYLAKLEMAPTLESHQLALFDSTPPLEEDEPNDAPLQTPTVQAALAVIQALQTLDVDNLSARDALQTLYALHESACQIELDT